MQYTHFQISIKKSITCYNTISVLFKHGGGRLQRFVVNEDKLKCENGSIRIARRKLHITPGYLYALTFVAYRLTVLLSSCDGKSLGTKASFSLFLQMACCS
jgi:hypothetical protein